MCIRDSSNTQGRPMCYLVSAGSVTSFLRDSSPGVCGTRHPILRDVRVTRARRRETVDNHGAAYTHCTRPGNRCPSRPPHASLPSSLRFRHLVSAGDSSVTLWGARDGPPDRSGNASGRLIVPSAPARGASKIRLAATQARCGRPPRRDAEGPRAHTTSGPCMLSPAYAGGSRPAP